MRCYTSLISWNGSDKSRESLTMNRAASAPLITRWSYESDRGSISRISGWPAHILEQYANNRLIRPRADYTGPAYPQRFVPLDQR